MPPQNRHPARAALERASTPILLRMHALPRWLPPVVMLAIALAGLIVSGPIGFVLLLSIALFLTWLAVLSWPQLSGQDRLVRVLASAAVLVGAILQL